MEQLLSFPSSFIKWGLDAEDTSQAMGLARPLVSRWYKGRVHDGLSNLVLTVPRLDILLYATLKWTAIASKVLGEQGHLPWWLTPKFGLISQTWSYVEVCDPLWWPRSRSGAQNKIYYLFPYFHFFVYHLIRQQYFYILLLLNQTISFIFILASSDFNNLLQYNKSL